MPINFPSNPQVNQTITSGSTTWRYNGIAWTVVPPDSLNLTNLTSTNINVTNLSVSGTVTGINQTYALSQLTDVDFISPPTDQQILQYNSASQKWRAATVASGGAAFNGGTITNPLFINNTTNSTSNTTGALRVAGGMAVGDDIFLSGNFTVASGTKRINLNSASEIRYYNDLNTGFVGFKAPATISANRTYTLPQTDGTSGQVLRTNGAGVLSWVSVVSPTGGLAAPGQNTQIVFNDNDDFGADAALTFDRTSQTFSTVKVITSGDITVNNSTASTNSTTGAVKVSGGVGIAGQLNVGGAVNRFTGGTSSTSSTTGTIIVTGGLGVSGRINTGSTVSADTAPTAAEHLTNKRYVDANVLAFSVAFGA